MKNYLRLLILTGVLILSVIFIGGKFAWGIVLLLFIFFISGLLLGNIFHKGIVLMLWHSRNEFISGENVTFNLVLSNTGVGFAPWVRMDMELPKKLSGKNEKGKLLFVGPISRVNANYSFDTRYKGYYRFENVKIHYSDIFHLFHWTKAFDDSYTFIVKPKLKKLSGFESRVRQPFGKYRSKNAAFEDLSSIKDIRKYQTGDSFKKMHWKISAHRGELFIREPEASGSAELIVVLDLYHDSYGKDDFLRYGEEEACGECVAAIVYKAFREGKNVKMHYYTEKLNTVKLEVEKGMDPVLELLASTEGNSSFPVSEFIKYECGKFGNQSEIFIVTNDISKSFDAETIGTKFNNITVLSNRKLYTERTTSMLIEAGLRMKSFSCSEETVMIGETEIEKG